VTGVISQGLRFGLVGIAATSTHFLVALGAMTLTVPALWANAFGFVIAFQVSFAGHRHFTFSHQNLAVATSRGRFAVTALVGFVLNEALLAALLNLTQLSDVVALAIALLSVALVTFLISKYWAFLPSDHS
jgi:putative flippase GtrA